MPASFPGTIPEYLVFQQLTRIGIEFDYQASRLGGRMERGGAVLDFFIPSLNIGLNVQSTYWHYARPAGRISDNQQREALEAQGITMIYLDEEDLLRNARFYVAEALEGRDHSRVMSGLR